MSFDMDRLSDMYMDVLKEIGNIGAGNAATSLSLMVGKPIGMDVPKLNILEFSRVGDLIGGADREVIGVYLEFYGDISGTIMLMLDEPSTIKLLTLLLGQGKEIEGINDLEDMDISALSEVGNILTGSFLTALAEMTGLNIKYTTPDMSIDMAGAILSVPLIVFGQQGDKALFIETNFIEGAEQVTGNLFLVPSLDSYAILLQALGVV